MEPILVNYEDFPESMENIPGMQTLPFEVHQGIRMKEIIYDSANGLRVLYIYHEEKGKWPLILYVQGSAWRKQDLYTHVFDLYEFAKRGYNIAITEYRASTEAAFPAQIMDAKLALKYMTDRADRYHIDMDHIFLWGDSSGGHTVMMMAATHNREYQNFELPPIKGVIDFYGPTHIATMNDYPSTQDHRGPESPEGMLIGGVGVLENQTLADLTIIMNYIEEEKDLVPVLIMHGSKDRFVPFHQSVELYEDLKAKKKKAAFYKLAGADHGGAYFWHQSAMDTVHRFIMDIQCR